MKNYNVTILLSGLISLSVCASPRHQNEGSGTIIGGILGGVLGNQVGCGNSLLFLAASKRFSMSK